MSALHTPNEIHEFAAKHAPALAEKITRLCGQVIAKGMTGILEEVCRIQQERDELLGELQKLLALADAACAATTQGAEQVALMDLQLGLRDAKAAIAKVTGGAS